MCLSEVGGGIFEGGLERAFPWDSEISERPFPGDGIRLGGRIWDVRTYLNAKMSVLAWTDVWIVLTEFSSEESILQRSCSNCYMRKQIIAYIKELRCR